MASGFSFLSILREVRIPFFKTTLSELWTQTSHFSSTALAWDSLHFQGVIIIQVCQWGNLKSEKLTLSFKSNGLRVAPKERGVYFRTQMLSACWCSVSLKCIYGTYVDLRKSYEGAFILSVYYNNPLNWLNNRSKSLAIKFTFGCDHNSERMITIQERDLWQIPVSPLCLLIGPFRPCWRRSYCRPPRSSSAPPLPLTGQGPSEVC